MRILFFAFASVLLVAALVSAADQQTQPQMSPEQQKMMEAWSKAMTPGPQHKELADMAGSWDFKATFTMTPGAPPSESTGTAERTMILGGRVLQEKVTSMMMNQPFEGLGFTGYDNVSGKYWATWTDNTSTGVMTSTGTCQADKCEFTGSYNDPMTGKPRKQLMTMTKTPDKETSEAFDIGPNGKRVKVMEITYTRKK